MAQLSSLPHEEHRSRGHVCDRKMQSRYTSRCNGARQWRRKYECSKARIHLSTLQHTLLPVRPQLLVMGFLPTRLRLLNLIVLRLEALRRLLACEDFLDQSPLPILVLQSRTVIFRRSLNDRANLRKLRHFRLRVLFLVVALGVEHISHAQELEVALEFGSKVGFGHVEPVGAGGRFLDLVSC